MWQPRNESKYGHYRISKALTVPRLFVNFELHTKGIAKLELDQIMKAKSLLLAGAVVFASAAGAMAQGTVFSVNAVGFVNKTFPAGKFSLASNPLIAADNQVQSLFSAAPAGTQIFKFNPLSGSFETASLGVFGWVNGTTTLVPGEGFFVKNGGTSDFTITFVGNVSQGSLTNSLVAGFNLVSSQVPQAGLVTTDLAMPTANGDQVFRFNPDTGYTTHSLGIFGWVGGEPSVEVGEGFFVKKNAAANWTRTFSVNN